MCQWVLGVTLGVFVPVLLALSLVVLLALLTVPVLMLTRPR